MAATLEVVRLLISSADRAAGSPISPLLLAAQHGHLEVVRLLLGQGADTEIVNQAGHTALVEVARKGLTELVALLLSYGAHVNFITEDGKSSALSLACANGHLETARILVKVTISGDGAEINNCAVPPLFEAACVGKDEIVDWLLRLGVPVQHQNSDGDTALIKAARHGQTAVGRILLEHGADVEALNHCNRSALMEAAAGGYSGVVLLLLGYGANVNRPSPDNTATALSLLASLIDMEMDSDEEGDPQGGRYDSQDRKGHRQGEAQQTQDADLFWQDRELQKRENNVFRQDENCFIEGEDVLSQDETSYSSDSSTECSDDTDDNASDDDDEDDDGDDAEAAASEASDSEAAAQPLSGPVTGAQLTRRAEFLRQQRLDIRESIVQYLRDDAALSRLKTTLRQQETVTPAEREAFMLERDRLQQVHQQLQQRLRESEQEITEDFKVIHQNEEVPISPQQIEARGRRFLPEFLVNRVSFSDQQSPLGMACSLGNVEVLLLHKGANHRHQASGSLETPLTVACMGAHHQIAHILIQRGARVEHRNGHDNTPLMLAAASGSVQIVRLLLREAVDINSRRSSRSNVTPLILAASHGHLDVVRYLLMKGCDVSARVKGNKQTALTLACFKGHDEVTEMTPLMAAAYQGFPKVVRLLLERDVDVNATVPGGGGKTALMLAAWRGHTTLVMLLIARGVAIEARNTAGRTALWWALDAGHGTIARLLQTCGASVDVQDTRQVSCIMAAYRGGNVELVRWLLECVSQLPSVAELKQCLRSRSKKRSIALRGPPLPLGTLFKRRAQCLYFIRAEMKQRGY
ncbi:ankyrin repeat domain-containing protein 17-like [Pollicipes pollicipes]|uniref:ankyrin repeat domain-containing protein 17-like n=1 Tax=Pollicipes pollicipes TaxID=41117 RepID=UPI00188537A7|nr:ankyrin repeat domain-containing protein 17-like [Pollicipes pollicipes]